MPQTDPHRSDGSDALPSELGSDALLRAMDVAGIAVGIVNTTDTGFITLNQSMADLLAVAVDHAIGLRLSDFRVGEKDKIRDAMIASGGKTAKFKNIEIRTAVGETMHVDATIGAYGTFRGVECLLIVLADESIRVEAQLQARRLIEAADQVSDLVVIHDLGRGTIRYCNASYTAFTGRSTDDLDDPFSYIDPSNDHQIAKNVLPTLQSNGAMTGTFQVMLPDGPHWMSGTIVGEHQDGELRFITSVLSDVTEEHRRAVVLKHDIAHDQFTGLANRAGVVAHLTQLTRSTDHQQSIDDLVVGKHHHATRPQVTAVCHLDLDRFQAINDVLGHEVGDQVIHEVARRLTMAVRRTEVVGRINGDEFIVVFENVDGPDHALKLAARLRSEVFDEPIMVADHPIMTTASFGVSVSGPGFEGESLLRAADVALYRAKHLGQSQIEVYTAELQVESVRRSQMIEDLRHALASEQLTAWYQPIISLTTGRVTSVEALVRWPRLDGTITSPDEFIHIAESVGLIEEIDRFVLGRALDEIGQLVDAGLDLELHVNLSATRLTDDSLPNEVARSLMTRGYDSRRLCIELTETTLAVDPDKAQQIVRELSDLGVRVAIDDFGTGYSSLASLHQFSVDVLKIDKSFVQLLTEDGDETHPIVATILQLAETMGLEVVAEGIETEHQRSFLAASSCALGQGFLFHRPMPFEALRSLVISEAGELMPAAELGQSSRRS